MRRLFLLVAMAWCAGGCVLWPVALREDPLAVRVAALDTRVTRAETRAGQLEHAYGVAEAATTTASTVAPTVTAAAVPTVSGAAAPLPSRLIAPPRRPEAIPFSTKKALIKLARGVVNTVTGWVEVPKRVYETCQTSGAFVGWTWGVLRGMGHGFVRTAGGVYEVATFPFPAPPDYRPVIRPEYIFLCS